MISGPAGNSDAYKEPRVADRRCINRALRGDSCAQEMPDLATKPGPRRVALLRLNRRQREQLP